MVCKPPGGCGHQLYVVLGSLLNALTDTRQLLGMFGTVGAHYSERQLKALRQLQVVHRSARGSSSTPEHRRSSCTTTASGRYFCNRSESTVNK